MKKSISTVLLIMGLFVAAQSFGQELTWYTWEDGYKLAKKDNKIMLIDAYTEWCGWCKVMDKKTYTDSTIIALIEENFVPIKLNPEVEATYEYLKTDYTGPQLIKFLSDSKFTGYPSTFFVFTKSDDKYMEVGYKDVTVFKTILEKYIQLN